MPTARYVFVRATAAKGLAPVRIVNSATASLMQWSRLVDGRGYEVEAQDEAKLLAVLNWDASDHAAVEDICLYCEAYGIEGLPIRL